MKLYRMKSLLVVVTIVLISNAFAARTAQMLYFRAPKGAPETAFVYQKGKAAEKIELKRNNFSSSFKLASGDLVLRFLPREVAADEEFPKNAPSVRIPRGWGKVLLLAFPDPENTVFPIRFKVINADAGTFGEGDQMFINFTDSDVLGYVGKIKLTLRARSTEIVKNAAAPGEEFQARLDRIDLNTKKRITFIRQVWRQSAKRRSLMFIYSPPGSSAITYYNAPVRDL
ncbi:hypothetical protein [Rubritalea sp.]|uniref:hypothetical protein n=1 Tax=Rubritalea sp. TaxID=2109375 RepID=UPI003EF7D7EF